MFWGMMKLAFGRPAPMRKTSRTVPSTGSCSFREPMSVQEAGTLVVVQEAVMVLPFAYVPAAGAVSVTVGFTIAPSVSVNASDASLTQFGISAAVSQAL